MVRNETNSEIIREIGNLVAKQEGKIYTHAGNMHADDVYACAAASLLVDPTTKTGCKVVRVDDKELLALGIDDSNALILDIGKGRFDHHFRDEPEKKQFYSDCFWFDYYEGHDGRVPIEKSSVAKLWSYAGPEIVYQTILAADLGEEPNSEICCKAADKIEKCLISKISDTDTRGQFASPNLIAARVSHMNDYAELVDVTMETAFNSELAIAIQELRMYCVTEYADFAIEGICKNAADYAASEGHPLWVNMVPWGHVKPIKFVDAKTPILFEVCKSNRTPGQWNLLAVNTVKAPIVVGKISDIPGYLMNPIASLAIFDSAEAAEKAAEELTKDL